MEYTPEGRRKTRKLLPVLVLGYLVAFFAIQSPKVFDYYRVSDDIRQQIYPLYKFRDTELFKDDLLTRYFLSHTPPVYYYAHYPIAMLINLVVWSKIAQAVLLAVVLWLLFVIGKEMDSAGFGWILVFLFVHSPALSGMTEGGLPRAYALPAVVVFLWATLTDRVLVALAVVAISAVFYPPIFLVLGPAYALWCLYKRTFTGWNLAALAIVVIGIYPMLFRGDEIGHIVSFSEAKRMPEWQVGSRFPFVPISPVWKVGVQEFSSAFTPGAWSWVFVVIGVYGLVRYRLVGLAIIFVVSIVMYEVTSLVAFRLHIPDRTVIYSLPIVGLMAVTRVLWGPRKTHMMRLALIAIVFWFWGSGLKTNLNLWADQRHAAKLYEFVATLPKHTVIAGPPVEMDNIPLFAQRIVFVSDEAAQPLYDRFYQEMKRRLMEFYAAYYATDEIVIRDFALKNKVGYMVVKKEDFTHRLHRDKYYFEPYNTYIRKLVEAKNVGDFAVLHFPVVYDDGNFRIVDLSLEQRGTTRRARNSSRKKCEI